MGQILAWPGPRVVPSRISRFEANQYGHIVLTVINSGRSGPSDLATLDWEGYFTSDRAASLIVSKEYEERHVLERGIHRIVLMPGWEIREGKCRTSAQCLKRGTQRYGYQQPTANVITLVRRVLSNDDLRRLGFLYVAALHRPIEDYSGCESQLQIYRVIGGICTQPSSSRKRWRIETAFAFFEP